MRRAVLLAMMLVAGAARASADPVVLPSGTAPVINIVLRSGSVTVKTWNRTAVQIEAGSGVQSTHVDGSVVRGRIPEQIPAWSQTIATQRGPATLPAETWVLPPIAPVEHDAVLVRGDGDAVVTVPAGTALLVARVAGRGTVDLEGYRDGVFFLAARGGSVTLRGVSGVGFVQTLRGPIVAADSSFARLRARNAIGEIVFSRCSAQQIEATSVYGNVVYDDGRFEPGLARFESTNGDVAIGIGSGDAKIGAHSSAGSVATELGGGAVVRGGGRDVEASLGRSGPAITASSGTGSVLLYDGSLRRHLGLLRRAPRLAPTIRRAVRRPYRV